MATTADGLWRAHPQQVGAERDQRQLDDDEGDRVVVNETRISALASLARPTLIQKQGEDGVEQVEDEQRLHQHLHPAELLRRSDLNERRSDIATPCLAREVEQHLHRPVLALVVACRGTRPCSPRARSGG